MKSTDRFYASTVEKLMAFLDGKKFYERHYARASSTVLDHTTFPGDPGEGVEALIEQAEQTLASDEPMPVQAETPSMVAIRELGKPRLSRMSGQPDEERQLERLALRMAGALAAFDEEISLHLMNAETDDGWQSYLALSTRERGGQDAFAPLVRSVYARYALEPVDTPPALTSLVYGRVTIPPRDKGIDEDERAPVSWITAVANVLPEVGPCHLTVRFLPLPDSDAAAHRRDKLCRLRDALQRASEADWSRSTVINANKQLPELNFLEKAGKKLGEAFDGDLADATAKHSSSAGFSDSFGETRHEKNKRAELICQRIDRELYRLNRALQTRVWQVEIRLATRPGSDDDVSLIASAMSGALKAAHYELQWSEQRCCALMAGTQELAPLMMFPTREFNGLEFVQQEEFSLRSPAGAGNGIALGHILWNGTRMNRFFLPPSALDRHTFVCGMTGSGKTNTVFRLLEMLRAPFLVIEPVKGEYRALRSVYPDLRVYNMRFDDQGSGVSLLRINPFWFPRGTSLAFHIDSIKTVIASAFEMSAAMPNILEQCLYSMYVHAGWNLVSNQNIYAGELPDEYLYPTFEDLLVEIDEYLQNADFGDEVKGNYRGAMSTRLRSFLSGSKGLLLNTREVPDYAQLSDGRTVLELEALADDADKCLVMGTILVQYFEYLKINLHPEKGLRHLLVVEEAHRLFKNVPKQAAGSEGANVVGQLVESLSNIMAEIRAFGEGMLIVDQSPSKIAEDVIKNSGTKIIHRIDNNTDAQLIQTSLLIPEDQISLPSLRQGEALIRTEGMSRPGKVGVDLVSSKERYAISDSFGASANGVDADLELDFAVTTLLLNDDLKVRIQLLLLTMLFLLQRSDNPEDWYRNVDNAVKLIEAECFAQRYDDMSVIRRDLVRELMRSALRQIHRYANQPISLRDNGMMRLFTDRLVDLYWTVRNGGELKPASWRLLHHFLTTKLANVVSLLEQSTKEG